MNKQIKDFQIGETIIGYYLLKRIELKRTTANKEYFDITLSDKTGEITAKLWEVTNEHKEQLTSPMIVRVQGTVQTFKDKLDFKISNIRPVTKEKEDRRFTVENLIQTAPIKSDKLLNIIQEKIFSIRNSTIREVTQYCFNKTKDKLSYYPAAKSVHHSFYSGLAYHIVRMIELAEFLCKQRPFLNHDLLIAGIILHDLGKTLELTAKIGEETSYSNEGKLLGHISIVYGWTVEYASKNDDTSEGLLLLQHLILSHHDKGEWGSPVKPQIAEAVALHYIDNIDAKLQSVEDALRSAACEETWTQPIKAIDNYSIYKGIGDY